MRKHLHAHHPHVPDAMQVAAAAFSQAAAGGPSHALGGGVNLQVRAFFQLLLRY